MPNHPGSFARHWGIVITLMLKPSLSIFSFRLDSADRRMKFGVLVIAALLGLALPLVLNSSGATGLLMCGVIGGGLWTAVWSATRLPIVPILCAALLATFFFRFEINLFPVFTEYGAAWGLNVSLQLIVCVLLSLAYWIELRTKPTSTERLPLFFSLSAGFLWLWAMLSVVYGKEKWLGICGLWMLTSCLLLAWILPAHFSVKNRLQMILTVIAVGLIVNGLISFAQYKLGNIGWLRLMGGVREEWQQSIGEGEVPRATGLIQSANAFAWLLVSVMPLFVAQLLLRSAELRWREKALYAAAILCGGLGLILSFARGSWGSFALAIVIVIALSWWVMPPDQRRTLMLKLLGVGLLLSVMSLPFAGLIVTRLTEDDRGSAESRLTMAHIAVKIIQAYPLVGVGVNSYEAEMRRFDDTSEFISDWFPYPVHNIYLHIAGESGIPGVLCFLFLIGGSFWRAFVLLRRAPLFYQTIIIGVVAGLIAFLLTGTKEPSALGSATFRTLFFLFGLVLAVERAAQREVQSTHAQ